MLTETDKMGVWMEAQFFFSEEGGCSWERKGNGGDVFKG